MMDDQKKTTVLNYITAISGEKVNSLLDLKNGRFYMQALGLLEQWNKNVSFETDRDRLTCVQTFLQDYYGQDVKLDEFLKFDAILEIDSRCSESQLELELAKIAVVLLGIGLLDKNGHHFIESAMQLAPEMHFDVMTIIESVVQAGSMEVSLTSKIEKVLLEPSDDNKSPPICILQKSQFMDPSQMSTPKETHFCTSSIAAKSSYHKESPLRLNSSGLKYSSLEITSPLRGLSIDIAKQSSPLAQFVQSPQPLQKATIKQEQLEIQKMKQLLNEQIFLKDELQFNLQDKTTECANKDREILKLQYKVRDLLHMRDSYDELQGLKLSYSDMESEMTRLKKKSERYGQYKEECELLHKENSALSKEVEKLHQDIAALEAEANKYRDSLKTIRVLAIQVNSLQLQLDVMHKSKSDWDSKGRALQGNLEMAEVTNDKLRQKLVELLAEQNETAPVEPMSIFMDIQLGDVQLRCQPGELRQMELNTTVSVKDCELDKLESLLSDKEEIIVEMNDTAKHKEEEFQTMKNAADLKEQSIEKLQGTVEAYEHEVNSMKEMVNKKNEQINELENGQSMLQEQLEVLKSEITAKETECVNSNSKVAELSERILLLDKELQTQKHSFITLSEAKTSLESVLDKNVNELSCLRGDLSVKCAMLSQLQTDNSVTQEQLRCKEEEVVNLCCVEKQKEEVAEIQQQLKSKSAAVDVLTETLNDKNTEMLNLQAQKLSFFEQAKSLQITCETLTDENEMYRQLLNNIKSHLQLVRDDLTTRNTELPSVNREVNNMMPTLCRELDNLISQHSELLSTNCIPKLHEESKNTEQQLNLVTKTTEKQSSCSIILHAKESAISEINTEVERHISIKRLKSHENAELSEQIVISTQEVEELRAEIKSLKNLLEEKCIMLKTVNDELLSKETVVSETRDELIQANSDLHAVQEQLICREEAVHSLDAQLKEVNLTLQNTVDRLSERDKMIVEKCLAEQKLNTKLSEVASLLQEKVDEISTKNCVIESMQAEHTSELACVKQETANMLNSLESQITLVLEYKEQLVEHLKANSDAELRYQENASAKEAEKLKLEQEVAQVTKQYEAKIKMLENHARWIAVREQEHCDQVTLLTLQKNDLQDQIDLYRSMVSETFETEVNILNTDLYFSARKLTKYQHQVDHTQPAVLGNNSHFFNNGSVGHEVGLNETFSSDVSMFKRETLASEADLREKTMWHTEDPMSSTSSAQSIKSITSLTVTVSQKELKRKRAAKQSIEEISSESPRQRKSDADSADGVILYYPVIRTGPVYQWARPPTSGKQPRQISGRFSQSYGISQMPGDRFTALGSPIALLKPCYSSTPYKPTQRRSPSISSPMSPASNTSFLSTI